MPEVKWTDEAIGRELKAIEIITVIDGKPADDDPSRGLMRFRSALLELKRVRTWIKHGLTSQEVANEYDYRFVLHMMERGDPAPGGEEQQ